MTDFTPPTVEQKVRVRIHLSFELLATSSLKTSAAGVYIFGCAVCTLSKFACSFFFLMYHQVCKVSLKLGPLTARGTGAKTQGHVSQHSVLPLGPCLGSSLELEHTCSLSHGVIAPRAIGESDFRSRQ